MAKRWMTIVALAAVAVTIAAVGVRLWNVYTAPRIDATRYLEPPPRIEMMHEDTQEWLERHFAGPNGKDERTEIWYRDGNRGMRIFRPDGTLSELQVRGEGGRMLAHLFFSPRGTMIVSGFERRNDGTLRLQATQTGNMVELRTFWQDGVTPFSVVEREVDAIDLRVSYFHQNGNRWGEQRRTLYGNPTWEAVYDSNGDRLRHYTLETYSGARQFYSGGKLLYEQIFSKYQEEYCEEHGCGMVDQRGLKFVDQYDEQGRLVRRITMKDGGKEIELVETYSESGAVTRVPFNPETGPALNLAPEAISDKIEPLNPRPEWEALEKEVSLIIQYK